MSDWVKCSKCGGTGRVRAALLLPEIPCNGTVMRRCSFGRNRCSNDATFYNPASWGANGSHYGFCGDHVPKDHWGDAAHGYIPIPPALDEEGP